MNDIQRAYVRAQYHLQRAQAAYARLARDTGHEVPDTDDEAAIETFVAREMELRAAVGLPQAERAADQAADALLTWAHDTLKGSPGYRKEIAEAISCLWPTIRKQAIAISLRIAA